MLPKTLSIETPFHLTCKSNPYITLKKHGRIWTVFLMRNSTSRILIDTGGFVMNWLNSLYANYDSPSLHYITRLSISIHNPLCTTVVNKAWVLYELIQINMYGYDNKFGLDYVRTLIDKVLSCKYTPIQLQYSMYEFGVWFRNKRRPIVDRYDIDITSLSRFDIDIT